MNTQEAYEQMRSYFSKPGVQYGIEEDAGQCMYRTPDGNKCAVGCLIEDENYDTMFDIDVTTPDDLQSIYGMLTDVDAQFMTDAQKLHDQCAFSEQPMWVFIERLDGLAKSLYLTVQS